MKNTVRFKPENLMQRSEFIFEFCSECSAGFEESDGFRPCTIMERSQKLDINSQYYPAELIVSIRTGKPTCTAFEPIDDGDESDDDGLDDVRCTSTLDLFVEDAQ
jgi:hypothetical protein